MRYCQRCVLPDSFPGANLDRDGVCAYCRHDRTIAAEREGRQASFRERFQSLCDAHRGRQRYDCLMAWSGGKDSTYTLALLRQRYELRVLAYTFDNGFVAPQALDNMERVAERLGVDHVIIRPRFDLLRGIFARATQRHYVYSTKALSRASAVCNACMGLAKGIGLQLALQHGAPIVAYGWSPGQAPLSSALFRRPSALYGGMIDALREPLRRLADEDVSIYFPSGADWERVAAPPYDAAPLLFYPYDEAEIVATVEALGWRKPVGTDPNSTNCLLNTYGIAVHRSVHGFHPYALELANLVRLGIMERDEAIARLETPEDPALIAMVRARLGLDGADLAPCAATASREIESTDRRISLQ
jgi:hypothetical protein